jgi:plasmid stabilization system protein ParE
VSDYALHPAALADIDEIWDYIAKDNFDAADRAIETIFENIAALATSPQQGHRRRDLTSAPLVFWRVYRY